MSAEEQKRRAALRAVEMVEPGMRLGLGTGSTAAQFIALLGERVKAGLSVVGVPTSEASRQLAEARGIPLTTLEDQPELDMAFDGADEIDADLRLIKGGGGALLREKIVAMASDKFIVMADQSKVVDQLGAFKLPVEVVPFGWKSSFDMIVALTDEAGCEGPVEQRMLNDREPFITDNGNYILDCHFGRIPDPEELEDVFRFIPGVVDCGLFLDICDLAIIGEDDGVRLIEAKNDDDAEFGV